MTGQQRPLVRCRDLALTYGSGTTAVVAVHGVRCTVHSGMRVALSGPSGCGKSSLLHLMAGVQAPTAGTVEWPGLTAPPPCPTSVGLVFQAPNLLPELDVTQNVALPMLLTGVRELAAWQRTLGCLAELGLIELADKLPEELSGGQVQRVAIARALAPRPRLILADEPTGKLDQDTAQQVTQVLLAAAEETGAGLVVATHDDAVAGRMAHRWRMRDGAITSPSESTMDVTS